MTTMDNCDIKNILLRVPNWIGDAVMSIPAMDALIALYPNARITVLAKPRTAPFFRRPGVEIMEFDEQGRHAGMTGKLRLARELKRKKFDMAVLFQNSFEGALLVRMAVIPERVGYDRHRRGFLLTRPIEFTEEISKRHQVFYYLNIVKALGAEVADSIDAAVPEIDITDDEVEAALEIIRKAGFAGRTLVGAAPGASYGPAKMWPEQSFSSVFEHMNSAGGLNAVPVIFGGYDDQPAAKSLSDKLTKAGVKNLNLAGETNLTEFMALASLMKVFISNDSGPMHVAAALGTPTVGIFGSTEPAHTGPVGRCVKIVRKPIDCSPCFKRKCPYGHYKCLKSITPEDVYGAAKALLAGQRSYGVS